MPTNRREARVGSPPTRKLGTQSFPCQREGARTADQLARFLLRANIGRSAQHIFLRRDAIRLTLGRARFILSVEVTR